MHRIEYQPHAADLRMRLEADSLHELFQAALEGMNGLIDPQSRPDRQHRQDQPGQPARQDGPGGQPADYPLQEFLELRAPDATVLLIDFLSQVLTLGHIHRALFTHFDLAELAGQADLAELPERAGPGDAEPGPDRQYLLRGTVRGMPSETRQRDIKAVSYHEAEVAQGGDGLWRTTVVFDI